MYLYYEFSSKFVSNLKAVLAQNNLNNATDQNFFLNIMSFTELNTSQELNNQQNMLKYLI